MRLPRLHHAGFSGLQHRLRERFEDAVKQLSLKHVDQRPGAGLGRVLALQGGGQRALVEFRRAPVGDDISWELGHFSLPPRGFAR